MDKGLQAPFPNNDDSRDSGFESVSEDWSNEFNPDHLAGPQPLPKEHVPCDNDSEYTLFPSLPFPMDRPVLDQMTQYKLALNPSQQQIALGTSTLVCSAWALVTARMTCSEKVGFDISGSGTSASSIGSLRADCAASQTVLEYLQSVQAHASSHRSLMATPENRDRNEYTSRTLVIIQTSTHDRDCAGNNSICDCETSNSHDTQNLEGYALILKLRPQGAQLQAKAMFDGRFIEPWLMPWLLKRLDSYLQQLSVVDSSKLLGDIEVMSPDDLETIWRLNGALPMAVERCVHHTFQEQAHSRPWAPAVDACDGQLNYAEVDQLSERLARHLIDLGVKYEVMVPICYEKS
ncbi:MAG: hypothetical protein Q9183_007586, partial [Haloplaca sp. 2 TL-2023]